MDENCAVYPGHPLTLAYLIVNEYPSLEEATRRSDRTSYPDALSNGNIPGAGGNVYAALDFLRTVVANPASIDIAIEHAIDVWAHCDGQAVGGGTFAKTLADSERFIERWRRGQTQADQIVAELRQRLKHWR